MEKHTKFIKKVKYKQVTQGYNELLILAIVMMIPILNIYLLTYLIRDAIRSREIYWVKK